MNRHMLSSFVKKASKRWSYCVLGLQVMYCHTCTMPVPLVPSPTGTGESNSLRDRMGTQFPDSAKDGAKVGVFFDWGRVRPQPKECLFCDPLAVQDGKEHMAGHASGYFLGLLTGRVNTGCSSRTGIHFQHLQDS